MPPPVLRAVGLVELGVLERVDDLEPDLLLERVHAADIGEVHAEALGIAGGEEGLGPPVAVGGSSSKGSSKNSWTPDQAGRRRPRTRPSWLVRRAGGGLRDGAAEVAFEGGVGGSGIDLRRAAQVLDGAFVLCSPRWMRLSRRCAGAFAGSRCRIRSARTAAPLVSPWSTRVRGRGRAGPPLLGLVGQDLGSKTSCASSSSSSSMQACP